MGDAIKKNAAPHIAKQAFQRWTPRARKAKMVGDFVPALMRPAFEKFGFSASSLLTDWEAIAGREIAAFTAPERLKWPRKVSGEDEDAAAKGATLVLRVGGARALEVEQMRPRLIERINAAFGYRAVSDIRIIQAPLPKSAPDIPPAPKALSEEDAALIAALPEGSLRDSFARMAAGLKARQKQAQTALS